MNGMRLAALAASSLTLAGFAQAEPPPPIEATPPPAPPVVAQPAAIVAVARPVLPTTGQALLPANTELLLTLTNEVNSKSIKNGERFPLTVSNDVMLGNYLVIPRGTSAIGEVTYRTGKGAFGKSAKMEIEMRSVELNGRSISISGHYRQEGSGNTGATVGTAVAFGPFAALVTGRSAIFAQGREFKAMTREAIPVTLEDPAQATAPLAAVPPAPTAVVVPETQPPQ